MSLAKNDIKNNVKVKKAGNHSFTAAETSTKDGDWIDLKGYRSVMFVIMCQARSAGSVTPIIQDSDDAAHADAAAVDDTYLQGTETEAAVDAANEVTTIGYAGKKRYVRLQASGTGATATVVVLAVLGDPENGPVTQGVGA